MITEFGSHPDLVTGLSTSTKAGTELVEQLAEKVLNVLDRDSLSKLRDILKEALVL